MTRLESTLEELRSEQSNFTRWQQGNPGVCQAVATGRVIPGTIIKGPEASTEIVEMRNNIKILQTLVTKDEESELGIEIVDNTRQK